MNVHKLTAGDGYTYLTRQVAAHDATDRGHQGLADYYSEKGEAPGSWFGAGLAGVGLSPGAQVTESQMKNLFGEGRHPDAERLEDAALDAGKSVEQAKQASKLGRLFQVSRGAQPEFLRETARRYVEYNRERGEHWRTPVPADVRAQIRTQLANELFEKDHGRAPIDDRERGSFMSKATRQQTTAVAGFDLTFTPVKTVSTLWALADREVAGQVEAAHHAAVESTLAWLEKEVLFTRRGRGGVQQLKAAGLLAAMFTHRDARSSDPHLHTHVAVSNKVQDADGNWLAVDGRVLYKANVTLSERYNALLEAELVARIGVSFADRADTVGRADAKRSVREIVGVDPNLARNWAKRNSEIEARRRVLTAEFQREHGRPPTNGEASTLAEKAWSQTRQSKHAPRSEAEQRAQWRHEAEALLGGAAAVESMIEASLGTATAHGELSEAWVAEAAEAIVQRVSQDRSTWQVWHLRAEAHRLARPRNLRRSVMDEAVNQIVEAAIARHCVSFADADPLLAQDTASVEIPAPLTRVDEGETVSVYSLKGARQFTSAAVLDAEARVLHAARATGGHTISEVRVGIAVAEAAANGLELNAAQQSLVREMATSGRAVQLALAPAGTGKTTAMQVLTRAWQDAGGTVIGLAPSAVAAQELGASINNADDQTPAVATDTLAKLVWHAEHGGAPEWMEKIDRRTLVLIDEAGMAATTDLAAAVDFVTARGGQIRLVGDDKQLASVAAGGVLRDITHHVGAVTLSEVHRFRNLDGSINHAEAAATLALREGDTSALAFYADRGRIHVGDLGTCADQAYAAWAEDRAQGTDSILIAPTRELVAELNTRAREDRLRSLPSSTTACVTLSDGTEASVGDLVVTRRNDRMLAVSNSDWVKNGDRWTVEAVSAAGTMTVRHTGHGRTITLPAGYVAESVQLGYATTVHGAQGMTTGTSHVVLTGSEDRNLLYVALSRGRTANHLYLNVASDGDPHNVIRPEVLVPPTALDTLAQILRRDGSPTSATTTLRAENSATKLLHEAAARYHDAVSTAAESLIGAAGIAKIEARGEELMSGLTEAPAWSTLRSHLALRALDGINPLHLLGAAVAMGSLDDARDPAAVLDARLDLMTQSQGLGPPDSDELSEQVPWLPAIPARVLEDGDWGPFVSAYRQRTLEQIAAVREETAAWTGGTAPEWAQPFLEEQEMSLRADLAVWRAIQGVDLADQRPTGPRRIGAEGQAQKSLNAAVRAARPTYPYTQRGWFSLLPDEVQSDPWITPLCHRLTRLERAGLPVEKYLRAALADDPTGAATTRPLPDEHQAAALWWRLVPHLGPAALSADKSTALLLQPSWHPHLEGLVGHSRAAYLTTAPAWPALVAAVDEAVAHNGWEPAQLLSAAVAGVPQDGSLTGVEVADALVLRIALLTDQPCTTSLEDDGTYLATDSFEPQDAAEFLAELYRGYDPEDLPAHGVNDLAEPYPFYWDQPIDPSPTADGGEWPWPEWDEPDTSPTDVTWRWPSHEPEITAEDAFPDPNEMPAERIHAINEMAAAFYTDTAAGSWVPGYLRDRIHTDLVEHDDFMAGYAPAGPRALMTHLMNLGVSVEELRQAGLIRVREHRDGTCEDVDVFRDRLILPIRDPRTGAIAGFLGRRNPRKGDNDYAGPKYLNTKTTSAFVKREALFGYAEGRASLEAGAVPVLVEGPMDALAITLGSKGQAVGLAPMGTALTHDQIRLVRRRMDTVNGRDRIIIATDADPAGWKAAKTAYWNLTGDDLDPTHVMMPAGADPSELFQAGGHAAIQSVLSATRPLAESMLDDLLQRPGSWGDQSHRSEIVAAAARIIAARGVDQTTTLTTQIKERLHLPEGLLEHRVLWEGLVRLPDPQAYAEQQIEQLRLEERSTTVPRSRRAPGDDAGAHTVSGTPTTPAPRPPMSPPR